MNRSKKKFDDKLQSNIVHNLLHFHIFQFLNAHSNWKWGKHPSSWQQCHSLKKPMAKAPSVFQLPVWSLKNRHFAPRIPPHFTSFNFIGVVYAIWFGKSNPVQNVYKKIDERALSKCKLRKFRERLVVLFGFSFESCWL